MDIRTHEKIDQRLCGVPVQTEGGSSTVQMETSPDMVVDSPGLVHGGFIFGLADHAAMIAVNDPYVVLGGAETRFLKPVRVGDTVVATARTQEVKGKKHIVAVDVARGEDRVFQGTFTCFVLDKHVLDS
jgi:acyl-coenzyme A thioesterase PaaI-like protein